MEYLAPNNIAAIRKRRKLSQHGLADAVGTHFVTISKLERGKTPLTAEWIEKLAKALRVDQSDLTTHQRTSREVFVEGVITGNAKILIFDDEDEFPVELNFGDTEGSHSSWIIVDGDALYPAFKHRDILRVTFAKEGVFPADILGELCAIQSAKEADYFVGIPIAERKNGRFDVHRLNGPPLLDIPIWSIGKVTMAVFSPNIPESAKTYVDNENAPNRRNLADWLKTR